MDRWCLMRRRRRVNCVDHSPCRFCDRSFRRFHQCPVIFQAAILLINTDCTGGSSQQPGDAVLRCDVCGACHDDLRALHDHLHQQHKLEPQEWDPLRDLLRQDPVCSHCLFCFSCKSAVRQHITLGQCSSFDPLRTPADQPVLQVWQDLLHNGTLEEFRQVSMQRLDLTLKCQLCKAGFQRTGDLSLHLQPVHTALWTASQHITQLLITTCQCNGCICNSTTNASGLQHVCVPYRQLGMLVLKLSMPLFTPWQFARPSVTRYLQSISDSTAAELIIDCLLRRDFQQLWTNPLLLELSRTRCLQCGQQMHPAELRDHLTCVHALASDVSDKLLPQLLTVLRHETTNDCQCDACTLIYNHPATGHETEKDMTHRALLAQIHPQHQCPVLLQLCRPLLQPYGHRDAARSRGHRNAGNLQVSGTSLDHGEIRASRRRQREQESQGDSKKGRARTRHGATPPCNGPAASEGGCRTTGTEAARLMDLLHANRAPGPVTVSDSEGQRMETTTEDENRADAGDQPSTPEEPSDAAPGRVLSVQSAEAGSEQRHRPAEGGSPQTWDAEQRQCLPVPTVEPPAAGPAHDDAGADTAPQDGEIRRAAPGPDERPVDDHQISFDASPSRSPSHSMDVANIHASELQVLLQTLLGDRFVLIYLKHDLFLLIYLSKK